MPARVLRSEYAYSASIAATTWSRPRRALSSEMRRSARRCAASCARRSPRRSSGLRMRSTSRAITSASSRVGGMTTPSSSSVRESAGIEPGSRPPTSAWWARVTAKPTSVRETSVMSGRCVPPAYGSLMAQTSPGAGSCLITAATASGIAPRCTGMCSACAIMRPRSSKSPVEQSRRSLMFAENAERTSTAPISSAIARRSEPRICSSTTMAPSRCASRPLRMTTPKRDAVERGRRGRPRRRSSLARRTAERRTSRRRRRRSAGARRGR